MPFDDFFSSLAQDYAKYRPSYPDELIDLVADSCPAERLCWDCGTGSGQAAAKLAQRFELVVGTDASFPQIHGAFRHPRVRYLVEKAEASSLASGSVDLVTVSTAVHWFDLEGFYMQVRRVSKPASVLAVWSYFLPAITPEVDRVVERYRTEVLAGHWDARHRHVETGYRNLPFPFNEINTEPLAMTTSWTLEQLAGFLVSWSPVASYRAATGKSPLAQVEVELRQAWGDSHTTLPANWTLNLRLGRVG